MKKSYNSPKIECMTVIPFGSLCGTSGTNDSGLGQQTNPDTSGTGGSSGWGAPHRVFF